MKNLEYYKKAKSDNEQELARLTDELDNLIQNRENLEAQITEAIDAENLAAVEKLTEKVSATDIKINAQKRIIERKHEKNVFSMEELAAANNADIEQYQKEYNAAREEAENLKKQYFKKMIEAGKIIEASNHRRLEYMKLAGIEELYISKVENRGFKYVRSSFRGQFTPDEENEIKQIDPSGIRYFNAMRS